MKNSKQKIITGFAVAAVLVACTFKSEAQDVVENKKAEFGIRIQPTFSKFSMKTSSGGTVKGQVTLGYGAGIFLGVNITDHVGVQAELMYSSINQKYTENDIEHKINLKYVNIPLLLSLNTGKSKPVNLNAIVGPQIGLNVGSNVQVSGTNGTDTLSAVLSLKKGDLGFAYGVGVDFGLNAQQTFRLGIGYRGVYGLLDISDDSKTNTTNQYYILDRTHIVTHSIYMGLSMLF